MIKHIAFALAVCAISAMTMADPANAEEFINDQGVTIMDPVARATGPEAGAMAAYLTIRNDRDQSVTVTGMRSDQFNRHELHDTRIIDGVASMIKQNQMTIPAGSELQFKPGGKHIMLIDPKRPMEFGSRIRGLVEFKNAEPIFISLSLRPVVERTTKTPHSPQDSDPNARRDTPNELKGVDHDHMMDMAIDDMEDDMNQEQPTAPNIEQPVEPNTSSPTPPASTSPASTQPMDSETTTQKSTRSAEEELDDIINSIPAPLTRPGNNR